MRRAGVGRAGTLPVGPPRILVRLVAVHVPEGVDIPGRDEAVDPRAFHGQKARILFMRLGMGQIEGPVGGVEIAAGHDGLFPAQGLRIVQKGVVIA